MYVGIVFFFLMEITNAEIIIMLHSVKFKNTIEDIRS